MVFQVGGVAVEVLGGDVHPHPAFSHPLLLTRERDSTVRVAQVETIEPAPGPLRFDSGAVWRLFDDESDAHRIDCHSDLYGDAPYKSARISADLSEVELRMRVPGLDPLEFPLDELLVNALLTKRGGVELHACGVVDRGEGLLFIGNSGGG